MEPLGKAMPTCGCKSRAKPKSAIFKTASGPLPDSSRFCGFRSRCRPPHVSFMFHSFSSCCLSGASSAPHVSCHAPLKLANARHAWQVEVGAICWFLFRQTTARADQQAVDCHRKSRLLATKRLPGASTSRQGFGVSSTLAWSLSSLPDTHNGIPQGPCTYKAEGLRGRQSGGGTHVHKMVRPELPEPGCQLLQQRPRQVL